MDQDIRALCYALAYNSVIFIASALLWIFVVRRVRQDAFKPNPKRKVRPPSIVPSPAWRASSLTLESSSVLVYEPQSKYLGFIPRDHWIVLLLKWDIARFASTDVYLYLLFLRNAAILFFFISVISMGIVFPVYWTARSTGNRLAQNDKSLDFFQRAVITNVRGDDTWRIWLIYILCWVIMIAGLFVSVKLYQNVRSDEFRASLFTSRKKARDASCMPHRFMANKYSVVLMGIDKSLLDASVVKRKLLRFFEENEILAVHIVMDFHEALTAHRVFQECLSKLLDAQKREELRRQQEGGSPRVADEDATSSYWAITLPSVDDGVPSPATILTREAPVNSTLGTLRAEPPTADNSSIPRTSATDSSKKAWSSTTEINPMFQDMSRMATSPKSCAILTASRYQPHNVRVTLPPEASERSTRDGGAEHRLDEHMYDASSNEEDDDDDLYMTSSGTMSPGGLAGLHEGGVRHRNYRPHAAEPSPWWPARLRSGDQPMPRELAVRRRTKETPDSRAIAEQDGMSSRVSNCLKSTFYRKDKKTRVQDRINHYEAKVLSQFSVLNRIRSQPPTRNVGLAFISFRHTEAVKFAISHDFGDPACPMFRSRDNESAPVNPECGVCGRDTTHHDCGCTKWNRHWRFREAPPPNDIVWENIHISNSVRWFRRVSANILIFLISLLLTSSALVADALNPFAQHVEDIIERVNFFRMSISGWFAPLILYLINALLLPFLVAWAANLSKFWRNSARDRAVLHGNINFMVLNSLVFPVIGTTSIQGAFLFIYHNSDVTNLFTLLGELVAGASGSFMTRYVLNAVFINSAMQLLQIPMFSQQRVMMKLGKKPKKWAFDFGYWYAFHLSVLAVCLIFAMDLPLIPPLGCIFFTAKYMVDKYNFSFAVWKVTAESAGAVASTVCSFLFSFHAVFLFIMASYFVTVGLHTVSSGSGSESHTRTLLASRIRHRIREGFTSFTTPSARQLEPSIAIPSQGKAKAIVIGGLVMLALSLLMFLVTFGERAQRSIVDHHAGKLRRIARSCNTWVSRKLADWDLVVPSRRVVQTAPTEPELLDEQIEELRRAYAHPYEREDPEPGSVAD